MVQTQQQSTKQGIPPYDSIGGKKYREILDLAKQGKIPISPEYFNDKIIDKSRSIMHIVPPLASNLHGSCAEAGKTFAEANAKYWSKDSRYKGYHVSKDYKTGEKILFPLAKILPDENGNDIIVADAKDRIILVSLNFKDGEPTIEYEHDAKRKETWVLPEMGAITCVPYPDSYGWHEFKNGVFVKSDKANPNANYLYQANRSETDWVPEINWNGFFVFGFGYLALPEKISYSIGSFERDLVSGYPPSQPVRVLAFEKGAMEPVAESII